MLYSIFFVDICISFLLFVLYGHQYTFLSVFIHGFKEFILYCIVVLNETLLAFGDLREYLGTYLLFLLPGIGVHNHN